MLAACLQTSRTHAAKHQDCYFVVGSHDRAVVAVVEVTYRTAALELSFCRLQLMRVCTFMMDTSDVYLR